MAQYDRTDAPGVVVGVVQDGELVFAKGYGMADLTHNVPITPETVFNIGSVSKQFTAFAIALLESRGELSLDDPVRKYLPDVPEFEHQVTLRHLLTHTSGYREISNTLTMAGRDNRDGTHADAWRVLHGQPELQFAPGTRRLYNNIGYMLLAEIVEQVGGKPFDKWMEENVFGPLGMTHTGIKTEPGQIFSGSAENYEPAGESGFRTSRDAPKYGSTGVYTTVEDLAKWLQNFKEARVGGPEVIDRMQERAVLTSGETLNYALGIVIDEQRGLRRIQHGGSTGGFRAKLAYYPGLNAGVVVLSNRGDFDRSTAYRVADIFFGEHMDGSREVAHTEEGAAGSSALAPALLERYVGTFQSKGGPMFTFTREGETLFVQTFPGQPPIELVPLSDSAFKLAGADARVIFHPTQGTSVDHGTFAVANRYPLRRIQRWVPAPEELRPYAGRYLNAELGTLYTLRVEGDQLVGQHPWGEEIALTPSEEDAFSGAPPLMDVRFERENGRVTGFSVSFGRTTDVWFGKQE